MPESSSPIDTSGRPSVTSNPVFTGVPAAMHDPVSAGKVACESTRLIPVTPQSSSACELSCVVPSHSEGFDSFDGGMLGVAANFQPRPPRLAGTCPGASAQLPGLPALPSPTYGKSASADGAN